MKTYAMIWLCVLMAATTGCRIFGTDNPYAEPDAVFPSDGDAGPPPRDAGPPPRDAGNTPGALGGACLPNGSCSALTCDNDLCVGARYLVAEQGASTLAGGNVEEAGTVFNRRDEDCSEDTSEGTDNMYDSFTLTNETGGTGSRPLCRLDRRRRIPPRLYRF